MVLNLLRQLIAAEQLEERWVDSGGIAELADKCQTCLYDGIGERLAVVVQQQPSHVFRCLLQQCLFDEGYAH